MKGAAISLLFVFMLALLLMPVRAKSALSFIAIGLGLLGMMMGLLALLTQAESLG